jgi:hypothetical protein
LPDQSNITIALSGNFAGPFIPQNTLRLNNPTGSVVLDNAADFARAVRPNNNVTGGGTIFVSADPTESSGGCGCDPACELSISGRNSTESNETITIGALLFPADGTYTLQWSVTGREIATGKIIAAVAASTYHVIGGTATKVGADVVSVDVDEPAGFGLPVSNPSGGGVVFEVTGKTGAPATWVLGGCAQANEGAIPPP